MTERGRLARKGTGIARLKAAGEPLALRSYCQELCIDSGDAGE